MATTPKPLLYKKLAARAQANSLGPSLKRIQISPIPDEDDAPGELDPEVLSLSSYDDQSKAPSASSVKVGPPSQEASHGRYLGFEGSIFFFGPSNIHAC